MKLLVAISSCEEFEHNGWNDALRETWIKDTKAHGFDYKFFHGRLAKEKDDVVVVDADDAYVGITAKAKEKYAWAKKSGYDYVFHCYHDTYACPERLKELLREEPDYIGDFYHTDPRQPYPHASYGKYCQGGPGYLISNKAFSYAASDMPSAMDLINDPMEDVKVGQSVASHKDVKVTDNRQFLNLLTPEDHGPRRSNGIITCHLSTIRPAPYRAEYMLKLHKEWEESCR